MQKRLDIDVLWGGYYAAESDGDGVYTVFRLLDLDRYAYQAALYSEKFQEKPSMADVERLSPFIGHAPIALESLLHSRSVMLIGQLPLTRDDLEGYMIFLEHHDTPAEEREALVEKLIGFSAQERPVALTIEDVDGELAVIARD